MNNVFPESPDQIAPGSELWIRAPRTNEILATGRAIGLAIEAFPPGQEDATTRVLPEGEAGAIQIDRPGWWFFRAILLAEDVCGSAAAELIVIQEAEIPSW